MSKFFKKINEAMSVEAEKKFQELNDNEKIELIDYVMDSYSLKTTELRLNKNNEIMEIKKPEKTKVSLSLCRLIYSSPLFIKRYDKYRENMYDFLLNGERSIFSRKHIACSSLFSNEQFVKDVNEGFYDSKKNRKTFINNNGFLSNESLLFNIWQSYFYNGSQENYNETIKVSNYILENDIISKQKIRVAQFNDFKEDSFHNFYMYITKNKDKLSDSLENDYFLTENIYVSGLFKTLKEKIKGEADFQELKMIGSNILNYLHSFKEINVLWDSLQEKNIKKVSVFSMVEMVDLSKNLSQESYKKIPAIIKEIIDNDLSKTEIFMKSMIYQFLNKKIIKENVILANEILKVLKNNICLYNTYKSDLLSILENHSNKNFLNQSDFSVNVIQTLIDIEINKNNFNSTSDTLFENNINSINKALFDFSGNEHIRKLQSYLQKKQIENNIDENEVVEKISNLASKKRL